MTARSVPRAAAAIEDLRVGQLIAYVIKDRAYAGTVTDLDDKQTVGIDAHVADALAVAGDEGPVAEAERILRGES